MNDFFKSEDDQASQLSQEQEQELRSKIQADVFEGIPANFEDSKKDVEISSDAATDHIDEESEEKATVEEAEKEEDSSIAQKLSPEMQAIVDSVNKLNSSISGMEDRIKQTERRIGGISNELYAAKEAAAAQAKAPTPEEMAEAAKSKEAWEDLKKDFPSWATAIDAKIKEQSSKFVSVDDFESLRANVSKIPSVDSAQLEARLVGLIHPDWKQIIQEPEYATWLNAQSEDIKFKAYKGTTAEQAIDVFNHYKAHKSVAVADSSEAKKIQEQRKKRLAASTTTNTKHKTIKQKSEADMSETELRAHIASKVFAS